jgi:signal transduction histidine kinase/DNA-binding response OmpR family regulator
MKAMLLSVRFLLVCCLFGWLPTWAGPGPGAVVSAAPDSAVVHLPATLARASTMQRLGGRRQWRYRPGWPAGWASPATNDHTWLLARTAFAVGREPPGWRGTGCFRLRFTLDSALLGQPLGLYVAQDGASDIYLDGHWLGSYGTPGTSAGTTQAVRPRFRLLPLVLTGPGPHLLAVRYSRFGAWPLPEAGFTVWVAPAERLVAERVRQARSDTLSLIIITSAGLLAVLHLCLFLFDRSQRANLYFSGCMAVAAGTFLMVLLRATFSDESVRWWTQLGYQAGAAVSSGLLLLFLYTSFGRSPSRLWLGLLALTSLGHVGWWLAHPTDGNQVPAVALAIYGIAWLDALRLVGWATWRRQPGSGLLVVGTVGALLVPLVASPAFHIVHRLDGPDFLAAQLVIQLCGLLLPVCMSVYLAREFAATRRHLERRLRQVEQLSSQTLAQETERRQLISAQNERLEATVRARTEEVRQQNLTLAAQRDELSTQADRLRQLDQEKTRFFTNITHELRTPLTLILGPAAQIADDAREPATRQQAALVQRNAQRLLLLINQLLDLSRLEAGQHPLHPVPGELVGFVRGLLGAFESLAQQRDLDYTFAADGPALHVHFDPDALEKVLTNLLTNAFKFTPTAGAVAVELRWASPSATTEVVLTVRDTGCGIAPDQLPHVFDRFYQVDDSATREQEGTGIGLALTKELVELQHGTVALTSEVGRGTTAAVRLPLPSAEPAQMVPAGAWAPVADAVLPDSPDALSPPPEAPLLLIIENHAEVRAYLRTLLAADYQLLEAENGTQGVALAIEQLPDLVLTDAMMPRLDGYGVCQTLKQDERTSHIPVVLLTAKTDLPSRLLGLDTGADAYLTKPFQRAELLAQLRNLVNGRRHLQEAYQRNAGGSSVAALPSKEQVFLAKVKHLIELHLADETLSVDLLSQELHLSRTQLHRKVKALTGQAPGDFIRLLRLQRAHELLTAGTATITEVAYQVGYGNPASFSTSFSRHFGYAPRQVKAAL